MMNRGDRVRRRSVGGVVAACILALALVAGCSGDDKADNSDDTDEKVTTTTSATTSTLTDEQYLEQAEGLAEQATTASGDFCGLMSVFGELIVSGVNNPTTPEQVKSVVDTTSGLFVAISESGTVDATDAATLDEMASVLAGEAEAAGYSVEFMQQQGEDAPLAAPEYVALMESLVSRAQSECPGFAEGLGQ